VASCAQDDAAQRSGKESEGASKAPLKDPGETSTEESSGSDKTARDRNSPPARRPGAPAACAPAKEALSGTYLNLPDATELYYESGGSTYGAPTLYIHGGRGYNAYTFRRAVGEQLESALHMVYVDQRGMGRSVLGPSADDGLLATLADFETLREVLGFQKWNVIGHSFGGLIAASYKKAHPDRVGRVLLVDTTPDIGLALEHQVGVILGASRREGWPTADIRAIAQQNAPAHQRLAMLYGKLGRLPVQKVLHYADPEAQTKMEAWDGESGLLACTESRAANSYIKAGMLDAGVAESARVDLSADGAHFYGEQSGVIGPGALARSDEVWAAKRLAFPTAGHFIYLEAPDEFSTKTLSFLLDGEL